MPDHWTLRTKMLQLGGLPRLMGVINVTPDSFSDGGRFLDPAAAIAHGLRLAAEGADLLDVGGESTRPGAAPVEAEEELRRVIPVIAGLCSQTAVPISIDTSKAIVAQESLAAGAQLINDVTALRDDPQMLEVVVRSGAGVCLMHMQGTPRTMQVDPVYGDVVHEVISFLRERRDVLTRAGVAQDHIALDPGIGFGKTVEHNLTLLRNAHRLHELGCPILVGPSRKSFIRNILSEPGHLGSEPGRVGPEGINLTAGTIGVALALARQGVHVIRVHDVGPVLQALKLFAAAGG